MTDVTFDDAIKVVRFMFDINGITNNKFIACFETMRDRVAELERELNDSEKAMSYLHEHNGRTVEALSASNIDNAALREVMKRHEWSRYPDSNSGYRFCVCCEQFEDEGHAPGCEIDRLLNGGKA